MMKVCRESGRDHSAWCAASASMAASIAGRYFFVELTRALPIRWMGRVASEPDEASNRGMGVGANKATLTPSFVPKRSARARDAG